MPSPATDIPPPPIPRVTTAMKAAVLSLLLLGLAHAHPALQERAPPNGPLYKDTPPGKQILNAVREGIIGWSPFKEYTPPDGNGKTPLKKMPGNLGMPHINRPFIPSNKVSPGTPGNPGGPSKKPIKYNWSCGRKRGICISRKTVEAPKTVHRYRAPRGAGKAGAFIVLAPFLREGFESLKKWDSPIGRAFKWIDDQIGSLQVAIGGPPVPGIYGNKIKANIISGMRSFFELLQTTIPGYRPKEPPKPRPDPEAERRKEEERLVVIDNLLTICGPMDGKLPQSVEEHCKQVVNKIKEVAGDVVEVTDADLGPGGTPNPTGEDMAKDLAEFHDMECFKDDKRVDCGGGLTAMQYGAAKKACVDGEWDAAEAKCRVFAKDLPEFEGVACHVGGKRIECGGGLTVAEYLKAEMACTSGVWDSRAGTCRIYASELPFFDGKQCLRLSRDGSPEPEAIQCGGGLTIEEFMNVLNTCRGFFDPEGGVCTPRTSV